MSSEYCKANCGFFGSSSLNGFCSVCYKTETGTACNENKPIEEKSKKEGIDSLNKVKVEKPIQKDPNRCFSCNKRTGVAGFKCRCEYVFCSLHRHSDKHNCTFDYKAHSRAELTKANPAVVADKIEKVI
ncbi:unnamed protein product [Bathycoccus prasinos]